MRLSLATLDRLTPAVARPGYDRAAQAAGIVHLGIGAFHRAHQAVYTDDAMARGDRDWGIVGVSLRSADVAAQLAPQDGLYTVTARGSAESETRLIGAVARVIVAPEDREGVIAALAAPATRIVSLTVTEKGYHRAADGTLDFAALSDEPKGGTPRSLYGFLHAGLARRHAAGLPGLSLVSCDNLAENGARLAALLAEYLDHTDPALARWVRAECACPSTMVDRIVPATTASDRAQIADRIGLADEGAVVTEPFRQWVIEDRFAGPRPRWEAGGAELVADVRAYEAAKLRMLNGAHSALAYLGLARGHAFVHQAIADPALAPIIAQLMDEAAGSLEPKPGLDTGAYAQRLRARFANAALPHRLIQIAMDGSQKLEQRWFQPLAVNSTAGRSSPATLTALAAWINHIRGDGDPVSDPRAAELAAIWRQAGRDNIVAALVGEKGLFAETWIATQDQQVAITAQLR